MKKFCLFIFLFSPICCDAQIITNFAGGGATLGDGGPATAARVSFPAFGSFDAVGNYYFYENGCRIRMVDTSGVIHTVAGNGSCGFSGDYDLATAAKINDFCNVTVDAVGNMYLADWLNYRVRKVDKTTGIIHTIAGTGVATVSGDGGPASAATLIPNEGICLDKWGNLFIIDSQGVWVRKIDTTGIITTIAGNGISGFSGEGGMATSASIVAVVGICTDSSGNLYLGCDTRIRKVNMNTGIITTIAGTAVGTYNGDNINADTANFVEYGICLDTIGNLYIADYGNYRVRKIDTSGIIHTVAGNGIVGYFGDGGPATNAKFYGTEGVAIDACGNLYIADEGNSRIRKVTFDSTCNPYPSNPGTLAVKEIPSTSNISIYPNPTHNQLTISTTNKINCITITNLIGQAVYTHTYQQVQKAEIDITTLPPGLYTLKLTTPAGETTVSKVLKE